MATRRKKLTAEQKGAEILFVRLSELTGLANRDVNVLTLGQRELSNTDRLGDYYENNKEYHENQINKS